MQPTPSARPGPDRPDADESDTVASTPASSRAERLRVALLGAFRPTELRVSDDSALHAGHAGAQPGGQTHYSVLLVSEAFRGLSRVERHRAVHAILDTEFGNGMHALALRLFTPEEHAARGREGGV